MSPRKSSSLRARQQRELKLDIFEQIRTEIRKMHSTLDLGPLLWVICDCLSRLGLRFDFFAINLIDAQTSPPAATTHFRTTAGGWGQHTYTNLEGLPLLAIWKQQKLVYRRDLQTDDPYGEIARLGKSGRRSVVDIPLPHGTLALSSTQPDAFAAGDLSLLQEMAAIAVVAGASGLEEVFQVVVREAARLVSAEWVVLFLYDELEKVLVPRAQVGHKWEVFRQIKLQPGEGLSGQILISGVSVLYEQDENLVDPSLRPETLALLAASMQTIGGTGAVAPLKLGDRVLGTLSVRSKQHRCTQRDLVLLERLAAQAALAIERAQNVRELSLNLALQRVRNETLRMEKEEDWTRVRNEVLEMQEAADWQGVLFSLHRELGSLVEFWFCSIQFIDQPAGRFTYYTTYHAPEDSHLQGQESLPLPLSLKQVLATGSSLYRRTRAELEHFQDEVSSEVQCIVDVPFPGGTVAMNSIRETAFSDQDIAVLGRFAQVISEGYQRLQDLRQLAQARQRLQQVQKLDAVGQLTAGIAHNFNNLLQANLGNINLAMLSGSAEVQGYLQDADAAAMRGADLVRQLMLFSRAEAKETRFRPVDLGAVIANTVSLCRKTIDRRIEMPLDLPADLPLAQADAGHLEQVLLNLYLNARDALEDKGVAPCIRTAARVVLEAGPGEGRYLVCVEVSDNGSGMDASTQERIFEPFFTTKEVGTGLGLATVYGILQRHQGWIECQSKVGRGRLFLCTCRLAPGSSRRVRTLSPESSRIRRWEPKRS